MANSRGELTDLVSVGKLHCLRKNYIKYSEIFLKLFWTKVLVKYYFSKIYHNAFLLYYGVGNVEVSINEFSYPGFALKVENEK